LKEIVPDNNDFEYKAANAMIQFQHSWHKKHVFILLQLSSSSVSFASESYLLCFSPILFYFFGKAS